MTYQTHTLDNGIRLVHKHWPSMVANCGVIINTGSRDEKAREKGMAHFIEHTLFKGTRHRKAWHILSRIENMGGAMNAFTTKEETCIYSTFLRQDYGRVLELFADISTNSTFPVKEIEKEKEIVLDEIDSYLDNPSEAIFDEFEELLFQGHPLGTNILGTPDHVRSFTRKHILRFMKHNYYADQTVICSVGDIPFSRFIRLAEKYYGTISTEKSKKTRIPFNGKPGFQQEKKRSNHQVHTIMGCPAHAWNHANMYSMSMVNHVLGGAGMSNRLNMNISEKYGFCYNLESIYQPYSDTGTFMIYMGTHPGYMEKTISLVKKEMQKMREIKLGTLQLHRAKKQLAGQLAIGNESPLNQMFSMGRSMLLYNKAIPVEQAIQKVENLTSETILETANEVLAPDNLCRLSYKLK